MSVDVQAQIFIAAPRAKVAEFMFDPKFDKLWIGGLVNVFPLTPGKLKKGSRVERIGDFMNRRFTSTIVVISDEPYKTLELSADEPFEMKIKYELEDSEGGTLAKIRIQSVGDIPFKTPATLLSKTLLENLNRDLKTLKKRLEQATT